jgi:glycosyltransferase involved in cell wall biosynthesis
MKVAFISRSTLYSAPGGDTVQIEQTARELTAMGVDTDILLSNQNIPYKNYSLLHFFNIIRPADILHHCKKAKKPFVVSTILCSYAEYDKNHRKGMHLLFSHLPGDTIEYLKTIARWVLGRDHLASLSYTWKGQRNSIVEILRRADMILPNSESEYRRIQQSYSSEANYRVIPNGVNPALFNTDDATKKDGNLVICAARIEGIKNQLSLIRALNNTRFRLLIIGAPAPNQPDYYNECRKIAAENVVFVDHVPQEKLVDYYAEAKVHVLPSWFETTGLSSIEAVAMGCNIVITDKGDTREYFGDEAFYCDPSDPKSILAAVEKASTAVPAEKLYRKIMEQYTWRQAAKQTFKAYQSALAL